MTASDSTLAATGEAKSPVGLQQLYSQTTKEYRAFFEKVRAAFNQHCDEIKDRTEEKLAILKEDDKEGRKAVLLEQKKELDESLSELKQLLANESSRMRKTLEDIRRQQESQSFDLDTALQEVV